MRRDKLSLDILSRLVEDFNLPSDEDIENEVEKYRTSQIDKMSKHDAEEEVKHQEMLNYFNKQKKDYLKNRKEQLKKYREENEPTEERLNAKREELRQKREKDREDYQRWFNKAKEDKARYFSDVYALSDLADKENPGDFKYGGFNVCFTYNGKSYWVGWYDSDVYLPIDSRDGYHQWEYGYEIPNSDVHKWKKEIKPIREMSPEEFGLEVKPGSKDRVKGIIYLSKLDGGNFREDIREGTIYKYDRDKGYGYFTSDGKEEKPKEESKKEINRNDFSNDEDFLASLKSGDKSTLEGNYEIINNNGTYQIHSIHPYDETDYSFAKSNDGVNWVVVDPEKRTMDMQHIIEPAKKYTIKIDSSNPSISENDLTAVLGKMKEIDSTKKPRIDRS